MKQSISPKQAAKAIGASEASLKRWCDKGILKAVRTAGGHRRIPVSDVLQFLRETGRPLIQPEILGLPAVVGQGRNPDQRGLKHIMETLARGDEGSFVAAVMDLYLAGHTACEICDEYLAPAFHQVGAGWHDGEWEVYQERRGVEICTRALIELRSAFPQPTENAGYAFGATLENDPYTLPTTMAEVVLSEAGWRAESFGAGHPLSTLRAAVVARKPDLAWVSFSVAPQTDEQFAQWAELFETASQEKIAIAVGGRGLTDEVRRRMSYSAYCDRLANLVTFASTMTRHR